MGIDNKQDFIRAALKRPSLFVQLPKTLFTNVEVSCRFMRIDKRDFIRTALKQPSLFYQSPETLFANFKTLAILFDNNLNKTREFVLTNPVALVCSQERDFVHFLAREITGRKLRIRENPQKIIQKYFKQKPDKHLDIKQFSMIDDYLMKKLENGEITSDKAIKMTGNEKLLGEFMLLRAIGHFEEESRAERKGQKS